MENRNSFKFSRKEWILMFCGASTSLIAGLLSNEPFAIAVLLLVSWCVYIYVCIIHEGKWYNRIILILLVTIIFFFVGYRLYGKTLRRYEKLPGVSIQMLIRLKNQPVDRRKYILDFGHIDRNRFSVYITKDNLFTMEVIDGSEDHHSIQLLLGGEDVPVGIPIHIGCEVGVTGNSTIMRLTINGKNKEVLDINRRIDIAALDISNGVIGADLNKTNNAAFELVEIWSFTVTLKNDELAAMNKYFSGIINNSHDQLGGGWKMFKDFIHN